MVALLRDGFEFIATIGDLAQGLPGWGLWASASNLTVYTSASSGDTRFGRGQSIGGFLGGLVDPAVKSPTFANRGTLFAAFAYSTRATLGSVTSAFGVTFYDGTTPQCAVAMMQDGTINVQRGYIAADFFHGSTTIATFSGAYIANEWDQFQIQVIFSATVGEVHIRRNGSTTDTYAATGLNNIQTGNPYANAVAIAGSTNNNGNAHRMDDFALWDTTGSGVWTTWIGDISSQAVMPSGNSSVQFAISGTAPAATNWQSVNQAQQDGGTTIVQSATSGQVDLYTLAAPVFPTSPSTILGVDLVGMIAKNDAGLRAMALLMRSSGVGVQEPQVFPNTSFNYYKYQQDTDPATSGVWASGAIGNILIGETITL